MKIRLKVKLCAVIIMGVAAACLATAYATQDRTGNSALASDLNGLKFDVQVKEEHRLGEPIPVVFSLTNQADERQKVKDIAMTKFRVTLNGTFDEEKGPEVREYAYDGSDGAAVDYIPPANEGGVIEMGALIKKPDTVLNKGESTRLEFKDIAATFSESYGPPPGDYALTAKHENGQTVTRKFEVIVDPEKTVPMLIAKLKSESDAERNWAFYHLRHIDEQKLIEVLEGQRYSENESLRNSAEYHLDMLESIKRHAQEQEAAKKKRMN